LASVAKPRTPHRDTIGKEHLKLIYNYIAHLLAMAIAVNALFGIESLDDLAKLKILTDDRDVSSSLNSRSRQTQSMDSIRMRLSRTFSEEKR
jgi:hypothetical protein